jgi:hypothetical protein
MQLSHNLRNHLHGGQHFGFVPITSSVLVVVRVKSAQSARPGILDFAINNLCDALASKICRDSLN